MALVICAYTLKSVETNGYGLGIQQQDLHALANIAHALHVALKDANDIHSPRKFINILFLLSSSITVHQHSLYHYY
jgi:hypothetical protein